MTNKTKYESSRDLTKPDALTTCQFAWGGLFDARPVGAICLVRSYSWKPGQPGGTPGPTLCGIDRFAEGTPGWSMGGGVTGPGMTNEPCVECARIATEQFPGVPIAGSVFAKIFAHAEVS